MELALEIGGCTVGELKRRLTVEELLDWHRYARRHVLPSRRLEITIAGAARRWFGGEIRDFLVRAPDDETTSASAANDETPEAPAESTERVAAATELSAMSGKGVVMIDPNTGRRL